MDTLLPRAFSLLLGVLAIAVVYRLGCQMAGTTAGLGAAIGLGTSAFFIHQLTELRMYSLFPLLVALTLLLYWQFTYTKSSWRSAALFFLSLLGLLYTHYMALPLVVALGLYHLLIAPKNRPWWVIALLAVVCGLLYLPWLGVAYSALGAVSGEGARNFFANDALTLVNNVLTQFSNGAVPLLVIVGWYALSQHQAQYDLRLWFARKYPGSGTGCQRTAAFHQYCPLPDRVMACVGAVGWAGHLTNAATQAASTAATGGLVHGRRRTGHFAHINFGAERSQLGCYLTVG